MAFRVWLIYTTALLLSAVTALGQQPGSLNNIAPIIQPGAPGESNRTLSPETASVPVRAPIEADISFMSGMVMHHAQAVEMVDLLKARGRDKAVQLLGQRISISQTDEINYMKQWLADHGKPVSSGGHEHMDHMGMGLMPGMLSPEQMKALAKSTGKTFDHLFLTGMIQHHNGALIMVDDLFATPGAGQDNVLYDFATDIDNTQRAEIGIMQGMLLKEKK
jgi:uncharacterized protein (DUF305 family)